MILGYTLSVPGRALVLWTQPVGPETSTTAKKKVLVDFHKLLLPEPIFVQDAAGEYIHGNATGEVFNSFSGSKRISFWANEQFKMGSLVPYKTTFDCRIVTMCLCIRLLQQRQPCLILVHALGEVKSS